jgi:Do/DeqQ family serine protease
MKMGVSRFLLLASLLLPSSFAANAHAQAADASAAEMRRFTSGFSSVAERVGPSVVQLDVTVADQTASALRWFKGIPSGDAPVNRSVGSGVIISPEGHILTNNHVIDGALAINVRLSDGRFLPATLVGRDILADLAVVKVQATGLPAATVADSDRVRVGEWVMAIGSPFGLGHTVTMGVLSAKGRGSLGANAVEDYLQTDASINPGNSGGPLVNLDGQVIGINTLIVGRGQGIGFAVPSNMARRVADQLIRTGRVQRAWIGLGMQDLTPDVASEFNVEAYGGTLINQVVPDGPAALARLQTGDVVAAVDGHRVREAQDLMREVLSREPGQKIRLEVLRGGHRYSTELQLAARSESPAAPLPMQQVAPSAPSMGISLREVMISPPGRADLPPQTGVQITNVLPGSMADRAGLRSGDLIVQADAQVHPTMDQVVKASEDGHLLLLVQRGRNSFFAALRK